MFRSVCEGYQKVYGKWSQRYGKRICKVNVSIILDSSIYIEPTNTFSLGESLNAAVGCLPRTKRLLPKTSIICNMLAKILQKMWYWILSPIQDSDAIARLCYSWHPDNWISA